ncbi:MAG TPA: ferrous iron transport protein B [Williamwhitmania sp.]|nr:ferrous iron transport protein B [Williamwhitmania sp.]
MKLSELQNGECGIITKVMGRGAFRKRITEMGFVKGKKVIVVKNAPLKDPIEYNIMGYDVSLRRSEAALVEVATKDEAVNLSFEGYNGTITEEDLRVSAKVMGKTINVALVGNPNSGKTTLFNFASGSNERVGNYSGVTVDSKQAHFRHKGYLFKITDLPGTYSLTAYTPEEVFVRSYIAETIPDIIINVVDASNLERNLYLTSQLIDMDVKVIIALNMFDELKKSGDSFDYQSLGKLMGIPIVPTVGSKGKGITELFDTAINVYADKDKTTRHLHINYGTEVEQSVAVVQKLLKQGDNLTITSKYSTRFLAIKLLEKDKHSKKVVESCSNKEEILNAAAKEITRLELVMAEDSETIITDAKYGFIAGALKETFHEGIHTRRRATDVIDTFLTHQVFGFPIFIFFMWLMFYSTFTLGEYPMNWIQDGVSLISSLLQNHLPAGAFKDLLIGGVIGGVGSVIVFLPNILILFFFISVLEDTGYMARAAFIMDKIMHKIGLHGKSFIPLIMGFGCNVPAIMATRTIENRNNRLLTMLINPFMSCSARLPVYILIIGAIFPTHAGTVLFAIYLLGILMAIGAALIFKRTLFHSEEVPFVMELPPYRIPTVRSTVKHMWHKGSQYLSKMGGVILVAVILIWALEYYPKNVEYSKPFDKLIESKTEQQAHDQSIGNPSQQLMQDIRNLEVQKEAEHQEQSYLGQIGKLIEPVIRPLGFDWKMGVSLVAGVAAKEIVVSTLGVLYQVDNGDDSKKLIDKLRSEKYQAGPNVGQKVFTPISALAFLVFILIYFPCIAVIAAIKKESGSWKWAAFTIVYTTGFAWFMAFATFQLGSLIWG